MPFLHDHRRRVPTQDVDCSIMVGMGAEAARATVERRLAFTVHGSAGRAGLRGVAGIDLTQVSAPFFKFVGQSCRMRAARACKVVTRRQAFAWRSEPRLRREATRCARRFLRSISARLGGMCKCSPVESVRVFATPRSILTEGR